MSSAEVCGDGVLDPAESCDLGIGNDAGRDCTPQCTEDACGDGVLSQGEDCDDGNTVAGDGCSTDCRDERAPRWSHSLDRDAAVDEWFVDVARAGERVFVLGHTAELWQEWASTVMAYDANGLLWEAASGSASTGRYDALAISGDRLVLVGQRPSGLGQWHGVVATHALSGAPIGESVLGDVESIDVVAVAPGGDLFLGGSRRGNDPDLWFGRYDLTSNTLRWSQSTPRVGSAEVVHGVAYDEAVGLYYAGEVGFESFLTRLAPDTGALDWDLRLSPDRGSFGALATGVAVAGEHVVLVGRVDFWTEDPATFNTDGWIASFSPAGQQRWEHFETGPHPSLDGYLGVVATEDGSVVASGYRHDPALAAPAEWDVDGVLVEYDAAGNRGRALAFDGDLHLSDAFGTVRWDGEDRVLVAGQSTGLHASEVGIVAQFELPDVTPSAVMVPEDEHESTPPPRRHDGHPRSQTLFVDFGGARLGPGIDGRRGELPCIDTGFDYPGLEADRAFVEAVVDRVTLLLEPFDVEVVYEAPPPGALPYTTVLVGGLAEQIGVQESAAGFACEIDCGNARSNELVFAFADDSVDTLANTIVHEAGHAWGLDHVLDESAIMSPFASGPDATVAQGCLAISDETSKPTCIEAHAEFCPQGEQDAHAELLARFGERRVDLEPPQIFGVPEAVEVQPGEAIGFSLEVEDDSGSPGIELRVPALGVRRVLDPGALEVEFFLPPGEHAVEFVAMDHAGHEAVEVAAIIVGEADGGSSGGEHGSTGDDDEPMEPDTDGGDGPSASGGGDEGCACSASRTGDGSAWLVMLLVGWRLRRRRAR